MTYSRFYFKLDFYNDIKSIYRLDVNDDKQKVTELIWLDNQWKMTDNLMQMITNSEFYLEEVTKEIVQKFTPYVDTSPYEPQQ
jgi:hypothetical protein